MPTFFARRDYAGPSAQPIQVADVNGNGIPDLVIEDSGAMEVMLGNGDGTFQSGIISKTALFTNLNFALADVNGDGVLDLVTAGGLINSTAAGISVSPGNGDGTFQTGTFYQAGSGGYMTGPVLGDFNGDGILGAVAVGNGGGGYLPAKAAAPLIQV